LSGGLPSIYQRTPNEPVTGDTAGPVHVMQIDGKAQKIHWRSVRSYFRNRLCRCSNKRHSAAKLRNDAYSE